jgi:indole-3-glycerol phosphate synthase
VADSIRAAAKLPLLRKDFIIDERQILESAEMGADAVLLIVRILDDTALKHLHRLATGAGLAALVEVHDDAELERALAIGAPLIGVNNRDLDTFKVDLGTTERLAAKIPKGALLVAESGLHTRADVARVQRAGAGAILVGEALLKHPAGIAAAVSELLTGI